MTERKIISIEHYQKELGRNEEATEKLKRATNVLDSLIGCRSSNNDMSLSEIDQATDILIEKHLDLTKK